MGNYVPCTDSTRKEMLSAIGYNDIIELYSSVPEEVMLERPLNIPKGQSEMTVKKMMKDIAGKNKVFSTIFRGAGSYNHYIPSAVNSIATKEEFITAYTPYQAEISQGILQIMFEYQTMICNLTGMDVSNASVYDGATAAAEAILMCVDRKKNKAIVSGALHPHVIETVKTYFAGMDIEICIIPVKEGKTDTDALKNAIDDRTACILAGQISFFGQLEDVDTIKEYGMGLGLIMYCNPIALSILKTPAECGFDIAIGEGQPLGIPMSFGGPYLGFMACRKEYMRNLPGRIVGETSDDRGNRAYVLTIQAREQHIRREKARSNICTNQANCALRAAVYMSLMGSEGLRKAAALSISKAHYLRDALCETGLFRQVYTGEFFNEFVTESNIDTEKLLKHLEDKGILGGMPYGNQIIWCATEMNTKEEIDEMVKIIREVVV